MRLKKTLLDKELWNFMYDWNLQIRLDTSSEY